MLKLVAIGVWVILVTAGATYGSVYFSSPQNEESASEGDLGFEQMTSEMTSIPVMRNGDIAGYLIMQLSFSADRRLLEEKKIEPMPFMMDAAFRAIFANPEIDLRRLRGDDIDILTESIARKANERIGFELVRHVLLQQLNFVKKEDIRTNWIGNDGGAGK